jgi:WD40 repeat protein
MDGIAAVWKVDSGDDPRLLLGHSGIIWEVAFSPDGKQIATASMDGKVKLWDTSSGDEIITLTGHSNFPTQVAYSPDGKFLATASADGTVRIYMMDTPKLIALAKERVSRSLRADECQQYLHLDACP